MKRGRGATGPRSAPPNERSPRGLRDAGFVGPVLQLSGFGFLSSAFLLGLCGSCLLFGRIFGAGLSKRTRVQLAALGAAISLTHSPLPCFANSAAVRLRFLPVVQRS